MWEASDASVFGREGEERRGAREEEEGSERRGEEGASAMERSEVSVTPLGGYDQTVSVTSHQNHVTPQQKRKRKKSSHPTPHAKPTQTHTHPTLPLTPTHPDFFRSRSSIWTGSLKC